MRWSFESRTLAKEIGPSDSASPPNRTTRVYPRLKRILVSYALVASAVFAIAPADLRESDPISPALYHTEAFQNQMAVVPNPPVIAQEKLQAMIQGGQANATTYKALADVEVQLLDLSSAEAHMKQYVDTSQNIPEAYTELERYYHSRLQFEEELKTMEAHAQILNPADSDVASHRGPYQQYHLILDQIEKYRLPEDPDKYYQILINTYPKNQDVYLQYIAYLRDKKEETSALPVLDRFRSAFPAQEDIFLKTKASLLNPEEALDLLDQSYSPLWSTELVRTLDQALVKSGKKREYLTGLKENLKNNPLDFDAVTRLFWAFDLSGNLLEAQNALNDYRLLKEQQVTEQKSSWSTSDLYVMARLSQLVLNYNDAARYYYALYTRLRSVPGDALPTVHADDALFGLFQILIAAEERPVQFGAGNLDYYKDIAMMDQNPGVLNGILSLILNGSSPETEFESEEDKAVGYFNRAQAFRILLFMQSNFPDSKHLPPMFQDSLGIFERYGQNQLIVNAGEQFFKAYPSSPEILQVAMEVADAYARLDDHKSEWRTYDFILPIAAKMTKGLLLESKVQNSNAPEEDQESAASAESSRTPSINYEFLLDRYISSLTQQKNYTAVVKLYRDQIAQYPDEQALYEAFSVYLSQNQLLQEEEQVYKQAIDRFQNKGWYEKLARWYLRQQKNQEYEAVSRQIIDLFSGTDVEAYLKGTPSSNPYESLYLALNQYANERFPYNTTFVQNILQYDLENKLMTDWEALAARYYFIDPNIRDEYLRYRAKAGNFQTPATADHFIDQKLAGDIQVWQSHFEEALPIYEKLTVSYTSDVLLNLQVSDLKRSLGSEDPAFYVQSAIIREHLGAIRPSDAALWTAAGETLADVELYSSAKQEWQNILAIDPYNPERYLEVATIYWDYYLFDDALATIQKIRDLKNDQTLFAYEDGAIQESQRNYEKALAEYAKSLIEPSDLARNRLSTLYQRQNLRPLIQKYLAQRLVDSPQDAKWWTGIIQFYAAEKDKSRVQGLIESALKGLNETTFLEICAQLQQTSESLGLVHLQEQLIQKRILLASSATERLNQKLELAQFYEAQNMDAKAENVYNQLYQEQPRSVGVINELLSYDWRTEKYAQAFAVYHQVLDAANADFRKKYLLEYAKKCLERKNYSNALSSSRELLNGDPLNAEYFQLASKVYAEQKDFSGLTELYKQGLESVRDSKMSDDQKKQRTADFRRGIIQADLILKDYTAALDQYIEIINREAQPETGVAEVAEFASQHGIFDKLLDYYKKASAASPKDHRWPMVLAKLFIFSGQYPLAVTQLQTAIAIRPDRTDLYQQLAECHQRLGNYKEAIQTYEKLYLLSYKSKQWLSPMAELYARTGDINKALDLFSQTLERQSPMQQDFLLCTQALQWGDAQKASRYGKDALEKYSQDMSQQLESGGLPSYLEAQIKTGAEADAFVQLVTLLNKIEKAMKLATFDAETLRSAQYITKDALTNVYPALLKKYLTAGGFQAVDGALFSELATSGGYYKNRERARSVYLPMVRAAEMAPAEEHLLLELSNVYLKDGLKEGLNSQSYSTYRSLREELRSFYTKRFAFAKLGDWLQMQQLALPLKWKNIQDLADIASAYRLGENRDKEVAALREYYRMGLQPNIQLQPDPVQRYLSLLVSSNSRVELNQAALDANLISANYFIEKEEKDLALQAIQSLTARNSKEPVWKAMNQAMLGWQFRQATTLYDQEFKVALDLRSIGDMLEKHSDQNDSVLGDNWFYYGRKYGEYLWWTDRKPDSRYFLTSDLEEAPTNPERQNRLFEFYSQENDLPSALQHADLELQLAPTNLNYVNDRAQTLADLGRREEAVALWKRMISEDSKQNVLAYELVLDAAISYDFFDSVKSDIVSFISRQIESSGTTQIGSLLPALLEHLAESEQVSLLNQWIPSAPAPKDFGTELLGMKVLNASAKLTVYQAVSSYLTTAIQSSAGEGHEQAQTEWVQWNQQYVAHLLDLKQFDHALRVIAETEQRGNFDKEDSGRYQPSIWELLQLQKALVLIRAGKTESAMKVLDELLGLETPSSDQTVNVDRFKRTYSLLKTAGLVTQAEKILMEMYERLLASGQVEPANYLGIADVLIQKQQLAEAKTFLNRMIYLNGENLEGMKSAAALMEKHQLFSEAIAYRTELEKRIPWDFENKTILAEDLLAVGNTKDAALAASAVLNSTLSASENLVRSARVYAKSSSGLLGVPEIREIEVAVRTNALKSLPPEALQPYQQRFRFVLIQLIDPLPIKLLTSQIFMDPENQALQIQLFQAYRRDSKWDLALQALDPTRARENEYYVQSSESPQILPGITLSEPEEDYDAADQPVEELHLDESQTRELALQLADCAEKTGDLQGQLYFLNMTLRHTSERASAAKLKENIDHVNDALSEKQAQEAGRFKVEQNLGRQG